MHWGRWVLAATSDTLFLAFDLSGSGTVGGEPLTSVGASDIFVQAREPDGETVRWTRQLGTDQFEWVEDAAPMPGGGLALAGVAKSSDTFAADGITLDAVEDHDGFVAVLGPDGQATGAIAVTSDAPDYADALRVAVSPDGLRIYAVVAFLGPSRVGDVALTPDRAVGRSYALVGLSLGPTLRAEWALAIEGEGADPEDIAASNDGVYLVGGVTGTVSVGAESATANGSEGFVTRVSPEGVPAWVVTLGGEADASAIGVAVDPAAGLAHVVGRVGEGAGTLGTLSTDALGGSDAFVAGVDVDGAVTYATLSGGRATDGAVAIVHAPDLASMLWAAYVDGPATLAEIDLGTDAGRTLAFAVTDPDGIGRGAGAWPPGSALVEWPLPWSIAATPPTCSPRACLIGPAPAADPTPLWRGARQTVHLECVDL